jgi:hypothetical protein
MDGQQRISSIYDFFENRFELDGLEQWPELNGRIYDKLPSEIKKGLDRRSISYIVLLKESATSADEEILLRQQVFERLNTGGIELENQEIRHCIYHSSFDEALVELSRLPAMRRAWDLPLYSAEEEQNVPEKLLENSHYSKMRDVEFVLRFFSLRHAGHYRGGMQNFLDQYMVRSRRFTDNDITILKEIFNKTIELAETIYGENLFCPWNVIKLHWSSRPQIAYADSIMVGISNHLDARELLIQRKDRIVQASKNLVAEQAVGTFTGQRNTKDSVTGRIAAYSAMLESILIS